jgi:antitoxin MazE
MEAFMHATLVQIGNSQGVRIPKTMIEHLGLKKDLELDIQGGALVIRPSHQTRSGWADAAAQCHKLGDDAMTDWEATTSDFAGDWQ